MLSDPRFSTLPFGVPTLPDNKSSCAEEDPLVPLNFDELLDIAREFEFTRTITHVWPCEEEPGTCPETQLDDILAAIVPTPNAGDCPLPLPGLTPATVNLVHVQGVDSLRSASVGSPSSANPRISTDRLPFPKSHAQVRAETALPIATTLQGWSPPNGSQFLDLDDSLQLPQQTEDTWNSPQLLMLLAASPAQPVGETNESFATVSAIGDVRLLMSGTVLKPPPVRTTDNVTDNVGKRGIPSPVRPSPRAILEPVRARSATRTTSNVPSQTVLAPNAKTPKSRPNTSSTVATVGSIAANYARAPRGGIPPHIARSVTKANILRVERERKVMQGAFSSTTTREAKKPSVLRRVAKVGRETSKNMDGGVSDKKLYE